MQILKVLIELPTSALDFPYSYYIEDDIKVIPFTRVEIKFAHQKLVGLIIKVEPYNGTIEKYNQENTFKIRRVENIIDDTPILSNELAELGKKMAQLTFAPLITCYQAFLPTTLKPTSAKKIKIKYRRVYVANSIDDIKLNPDQYECHQYILGHSHLSKDQLPFKDSMLKTMIKKGALSIELVENYRYEHGIKIEMPIPTLTADQKQAIATIENNPGPFLLFGVTGSGKTEVYIQIINSYLAQGKTAMILVPEISLTPQLMEIYRNRLNCSLAILHSALSPGEKYDEYRRISRGEVGAVLGTRSAVFAPLDHIGVIVIDEEHSPSYKQSTAPRYYTHDMAFLRAEHHQAKIILGSATPSIESFAKAYIHRYQLISMPNRISHDVKLTVKIVDMNSEARGGNFSLISSELKDEITKRLARKEQIILLINKRGFAPLALCQLCGHQFVCPNCQVSLVYHKEDRLMICHHCSYSEDSPKKCPICQSQKIRFFGAGTQRVEETLLELFPDIRIIRFDGDTTNFKDGHRTLINSFENYEADVLLGTQMVAKGFNFPRVTLIGVINAEYGLQQPHFRAAEQNFQLLTQVIGRAGRFEKEGLALLQSYKPNNYSIVLAARQDYVSFFKKEMEIRKLRNYPPFYHLCIVMLFGEDKNLLFKQGYQIKNDIIGLDPSLLIVGPAFPYINFNDGEFVVHIGIRYKNLKNIEEYLNKMRKDTKNNCRATIDVNPY